MPFRLINLAKLPEPTPAAAAAASSSSSRPAPTYAPLQPVPELDLLRLIARLSV